MPQIEPPAEPAAELVRRFPDDWTKLASPIITGTAETYEQAAFPSIFHAGRHLSDPLAEWYLYWSGHDGGGIRLHHADSLPGPWTRFDGNPLFDVSDMGGGDHVASPSAVWDPVNGRLNLYYHRGYPATRAHARFRQDTELATSTDGVSFSKQTTVLRCPYDGSWDEQERSYLRVKRSGGTYVGVYQGRDEENNNPGIGYAWSRDSESWETLAHPLWYNRHIQDYQPRTFQQGSPALVAFDGSAYVLLSYGGPSGRSISAVRMDNPGAAVGTPTPVLDPTESWEGAILEAPVVQHYDGRNFLLYNSQDASSRERAIGIAYTDLGGMV